MIRDETIVLRLTVKAWRHADDFTRLCLGALFEVRRKLVEYSVSPAGLY
jgi:hypothetical protein